MSDVSNSILGQVALGYSPFIDRRRAVIATRLTVFPLRPEVELDVGQLLHEVGNVWPATGARASLNIAGERLLLDLLHARPSPNLMVEVPAFMAGDPANVDALTALHRHGTTLLLKGRPLAELPRAVLPCFRYAIVELGDDRRTAEDDGAQRELRSIPHVQSGVQTLADMDDAFARGAEAVLGWPLEDARPEHADRSGRPASGSASSAGVAAMRSIVELIGLVDREAPIEAIEPALKRDPALAFRLLRYLNSPAFGLRIEIGSFRHALMILGYQRLKRWLALLLATAADDTRLKPAMFAAVRRGLFLEELVRGGNDEEMRSELFICGVFSLLDRMFGQPFPKLLESIPVPERVRDALAGGRGPFMPYLELVHAIEQSALVEFREAADRLLLSVSEINRAELRALMAAAELA